MFATCSAMLQNLTNRVVGPPGAPRTPGKGLQRANRHPWPSSTVSNAALAIDRTCIVGRPVAESPVMGSRHGSDQIVRFDRTCADPPVRFHSPLTDTAGEPPLLT